MASLTISINNIPTITNPGFLGRRSAEVAWTAYAISEAMKEYQRGNGGVTSGAIIGTDTTGAFGVSLGSWTYTPGANSAVGT